MEVFPDYRTAQMVLIDDARGKAPELINAYNQGWWVHETYFHPGSHLDLFKAITILPYSMTDFSELSEQFWAGFSDATRRAERVKNGEVAADPVTEAERILREGES